MSERITAGPRPAAQGAATGDTTIRPFRVDVPEDDLADLRRRIAATRWPERETVADQSQGVQLATMQELARYWGTDYDDRASLAGDPAPSGLSAEERHAYEQLLRTYGQVEYARYMASRPQTLYGIADSPVGLAAWLLDHNDADGQPAAAVLSALDRTTSPTGELTRDEVLDNITLYWLTNTGVSASRLYWEYKGGFFNAKGVAIPVAVSVFPGEQYQAPRSWTERAYQHLIYYNQVDRGGHFAAWEQPALFSAELRAAFRSLR
jgi:Epoxide hydrolase N terminus